MNHTEVITQITAKTGLPAETCNKIVKAFEQQSGDSLINRFKGIKDSHEDTLAGTTEKSGCSIEDCSLVLQAMDEVLDAGLSGKLRFFKRQQ